MGAGDAGDSRLLSLNSRVEWLKSELAVMAEMTAAEEAREAEGRPGTPFGDEASLARHVDAALQSSMGVGGVLAAGGVGGGVNR
jgi:hypothetical protein